MCLGRIRLEDQVEKNVAITSHSSLVKGGPVWMNFPALPVWICSRRCRFHHQPTTQCQGRMWDLQSTGLRQLYLYKVFQNLHVADRYSNGWRKRPVEDFGIACPSAQCTWGHCDRHVPFCMASFLFLVRISYRQAYLLLQKLQMPTPHELHRLGKQVIRSGPTVYQSERGPTPRLEGKSEMWKKKRCQDTILVSEIQPGLK